MKIILGLSLKRFSDLDILVISSLSMSPSHFQKAFVCLLSLLQQQNWADGPKLVPSGVHSIAKAFQDQMCTAAYALTC